MNKEGLLEYLQSKYPNNLVEVKNNFVFVDGKDTKFLLWTEYCEENMNDAKDLLVKLIDVHIRYSPFAMKVAVFFGGAMNITDSKEYLDSYATGVMLAKNSYHVKCGGYRGLMEAVSMGVQNTGGIVTGYTCKTFASTKGNKYLTDTIVCDDLYDRLRGLIEGSDLIIAQRGGIGTIAEFYLAMDIIRKMKNPPKVILIGKEFWQDVIAPIKDYCSPKEYDLIKLAFDAKDAEEIIKSFKL